MDIFNDEFKGFLLLMLEHEVEFLLIGGFAVVYYGYERTTNDMDLWINPSDNNKTKLIDTFEEYGIEAADIKILKSFDFNEANVFSLGEKPLKIDFLTKITGVLFDEAFKNKRLLPLNDQFVPVINLRHLITNKMLTGRIEDRLDVEKLQKINRNKNNLE